MSKENEKRSALKKELERRIEMYSNNPFFNTEPILEYCERIKQTSLDGCGDCAYINLKEREQYSPTGLHQIAEAVAVISPVYADPSWIKTSEGDITDAEAFIGIIEDPVTGLPKTRAFVRRKIEETGEDCYNELESISTVAVANYNPDSQNDEAYSVTVNYALITGFTKSTMFEIYFCEAPSVTLIKGFISDISTALKATPENRIIHMPNKKAFNELLSKLITLKKGAPIPSDGEDNDNAGDAKTKQDRLHYQEYDRQLKIDIVRRIKEGQLTIVQAAKEVGCHNSGVHYWVREVEKHGENAFRGRGPKKKNTDTPSYDSRLKMVAVKLVKENNQPLSQVAKELGVGYDNLYQWVCQYEKFGEDALRASPAMEHSVFSPNPEKRIKDMPSKEVFNSDGEDNDTSGDGKVDRLRHRKYPRQLKLDIVKRFKAKQLTAAQAAQETGAYPSIIYQWIWDYEKKGENAFRGQSGISPYPDKRKLIAKLFKDLLVEPVTYNTPGADTDENSILNLPNDKKKMMESCSYRQRKFDDEFKLKTVKLIKENQLPVPQVSEKLSIGDSVLNRWLRKYEKDGESAFPNAGRKLQSKQNTNAPVQSKSADVSIPSADSAHEKEKKAAPRSKKRAFYDERYKMAVVRYVKENNLSAFQVAKELGIKYVNVGKWIRLYNEHGENAFPGPGVYYKDLNLSEQKA